MIWRAKQRFQIKNEQICRLLLSSDMRTNDSICDHSSIFLSLTFLEQSFFFSFTSWKQSFSTSLWIHQQNITHLVPRSLVGSVDVSLKNYTYAVWKLKMNIHDFNWITKNGFKNKFEIITNRKTNVPIHVFVSGFLYNSHFAVYLEL